MKTTKQIATITLMILLAVIAYGLFRTGRSMTTSQITPGGELSQAPHGSAIDQTPLYTAQRLAQMSTSADELPLAQEALRLGDREMDLAFAAAVWEAQAHPAVLSAEAKQSQARLQNAEKSVDGDKAQVAQLTTALAKATGAKEDSLEDQLEQAKVQVELDQDEVDNAKQQLIRAGGDAQGRIEQLMKEHEAASRIADSATVNTVTPPDLHGLVHHYLQWSELHDKTLQLRQAKQDAESAAGAFTIKRDALESNIKTKTQEVAGTLGGGPMPPPGARTSTSETSAELVSATKRRSAVLKAVTNSGERIEDQKQLTETYRKWIEVVAARQRTVIHSGLSGAAVIVTILLIGIFFDNWLKRLLNKARLDRRQVETLHAVIRTGLQVVALGLILLVIFGPPSQLGTFLGLAGAGLTVALKDFIVAFFGWFVLMGKNGLRVGDWVEINGVAGEVVEINLLRTVLLETGNWTDTGHPTGRKVAFVNSYAIEGHFFNFTTSGQWMWDELQIMVPSNQDPYPLLDAIQKAVAKETEANAQMAAKEWQSATSYKVRAVSAAPEVNLRPTASGVEVHVRYITRAQERAAMRARLNQALVQLLHQREADEKSGVAAAR
jgi:small-conductance mechanosensitive channel